MTSARTSFYNLTSLGYSKPQARKTGPRRTQVRCESIGVTSQNQQQLLTTVKNGNDSLKICRVLNGMWQTSGGWGKIDRDNAVNAMLNYADAGLSTFDMADHCKFTNPNLIQVFLFIR